MTIRPARSNKPVLGTNMLLEKRLFDIASRTASAAFVSVVVEWKPYDTSWRQAVDATQRIERVRALTSLLVRAKLKERRTLHCMTILYLLNSASSCRALDSPK